MVSIKFLLISAALVLCVSSKSALPLQSIKEIIVVKNVTEYMKSTSNEINLIPLNKEISKLRDQQIIYSLGNRVPGDRLVGKGSNAYYYATLVNMDLTIRYPEYGNGAIVSYVSIVVEQTSSYGNAYVVSGGTGYRYITIIIEARQTYFLTYDASFFGYN